MLVYFIFIFFFLSSLWVSNLVTFQQVVLKLSQLKQITLSGPYVVNYMKYKFQSLAYLVLIIPCSK